MNWESIVTGIITGVLTGGITGYLTALHAMRQFKLQRAFDRQLEWLERTARALGTLAELAVDLTEARDSKIPDRIKEVRDKVKKGFFDLQQCTNEAVLYAEQSSYEQLQKMEAKYGDDQEMDDKRIVEVWHDTLKELSKPVRNMLGL